MTITNSDVNLPAKASAANGMGPKSLEVDQKCVRLIDFSQFYQIFTLMTTLLTFGSLDQPDRRLTIGRPINITNN